MKKNEKPTQPTPVDQHSRNKKKVLLSSSFSASAVIHSYTKIDDNIELLFEVVNDSINSVVKGDMSHPESMLIGQAQALQAIFTDLATKAAVQTQLTHYEAFLRLALKAQAQCRSTIEALSTLRSPPIVFANQANISHGPQQVNNGSAAPTAARPVTPQARKENKAMANELLESKNGERLDTRKKSKTGRFNQEMAPMGEIHGTSNRGRKKTVVRE